MYVSNNGLGSKVGGTHCYNQARTISFNLYLLWIVCEQILEIKLARTQEGRMKGFGFITFEAANDLTLALDQNRRRYRGRDVRIVVADRDAMAESERRARSTSNTGNSSRRSASNRSVQAPKGGDVRDAELVDFLASLGLLEYLQVFLDERITKQSLLLLTETDLKDMGIPTGPRRIIQTELKHLLERDEEGEDEDDEEEEEEETIEVIEAKEAAEAEAEAAEEPEPVVAN